MADIRRRCSAGDRLTSEQEKVLLEHLPMVRFLARRIHERLPQHVDIEDLVSAGVVGLMDAFAKFDPAKKGAVPLAMRSFASAARFWTACAPWTGVRGNCAARAARSKKRFAR